MDERMYWVGFSVFPGIGPNRFNQLLLRYQTAEEAWYASLPELTRVIGPALAAKFVSFRESFSLSDYLKKLEKNAVSFLLPIEHEYPVLLKNSINPPFVLFYKGNKELLNQVQNDSSHLARKYVGIVGTRKITTYGKQVTEKLTRELVDAGCVIVSGLAMGVDAVAHGVTIDEHGETIAVLGCGVDCCNPATNQFLYTKILQSGGVIVSEYPLSEPPTKGSFPSRNRIIAGLSHGVVVTEGAADSGALITAKDAIESGRKLFAVPGPITSSLSFGPNELIKTGATMVTSGGDILQELGIKNREAQKIHERITGETEDEQKIIDVMLHEPLAMDEIVRKTNLNSQQVGVILSLLEMRGIVLSVGNGEYGLV